MSPAVARGHASWGQHATFSRAPHEGAQPCAEHRQVDPRAESLHIGSLIIRRRKVLGQEVSKVLSALEEDDMKGFDISDDEMSKTHARYMIGGCSNVPNERLFRFGECSATFKTSMIMLL